MLFVKVGLLASILGGTSAKERRSPRAFSFGHLDTDVVRHYNTTSQGSSPGHRVRHVLLRQTSRRG